MTGSISINSNFVTAQTVTCGFAARRQFVRAFQTPRSNKASARLAVLAAAAIVDDKSVPEAHKGLHGFLYGEGGSEEHDVRSSYTLRTGAEDEGAVVLPVPAYLDSRDGEKPLGVYCVYDADQVPQYIGYSRNMVLAVKGHLARVGPQRCAHVRAMVYRNRAMASRANLERGVLNWINELSELGGQAPPGNADPALRAEWEGAPASAGAEGEGDGPALAAPAALDRRLMSAAELAAYEEKKTKMRKAMGEKMVEGSEHRGDGVHGHGGDEEDKDDPATRRLKLMKAMNRGDWSAVIHAQTQETLAEGGGPAAEAAATEEGTASPSPGPSSGGGSGVGEAAAEGDSGNGNGGTIVSPFQEGGAAAVATADGGSRAGGRERQQRPLTVEAVQAALEEVRPYLMADGGDVEVVEVKDGIVYLRLQGACSSCPSQSATMKGGIERVIRQTFGDQVRDILQLDPLDPKATVERVDTALNMLRGAISNLGGSAEVVSVVDGVCTIRYRGPPAIGKGVQGAIRDSFADIREVRLVD